MSLYTAYEVLRTFSMMLYVPGSLATRLSVHLCVYTITSSASRRGYSVDGPAKGPHNVWVLRQWLRSHVVWCTGHNFPNSLNHCGVQSFTEYGVLCTVHGNPLFWGR